MLIKRCSHHLCNTLYNENDKEFKEDLCLCGNILIDIEIVSKDCGDFNVEDIVGTASTTEKPNEPTINYEEEKLPKADDATISEVDTQNENKVFMKKPAIKMTMEQFEMANSIQYSIDTRGYIHFTDIVKQEELNEDKIVIYLGGQIYKEIPIEYDETIIGRYSVNSEPDIDLSDIDSESYTSRRHLMIYKDQDKYFARNLSTKNSVHINAKALIPNQDKELNNGDLIILSKYIVMEFKLKK